MKRTLSLFLTVAMLLPIMTMGLFIITANATDSTTEYTITYHLDGGTNALKNPDVYTSEDVIALKDATKVGYTFNGWYLDEAKTKKITRITNRTGDLNLYAKFSPNSYTATFNGNGADKLGKIKITLLDTKYNASKTVYLESGDSFNPYDYWTPHVDRYAFLGWTYNGIVCKTCGAELKKQEEIPVIAHTEEAVPGTAATCTTPGLTDGIVCKICGTVVLEQEEIPVAPHTEVTLPAVDATCSATGLTEGAMCSVCDQILQAQKETPVIEHAFGQWQITEEATADKVGSKTRQCDVCGHTEFESIPATGVPETEPTKPSETTPTTPATQPSAKPTEPTQKVTEPTGNATAEPGDSETSTVLVVVIVAVACVAGGLAGGLILGKKRRA